ncbi:MAG: SDR family NAD(P)-dependent oxidoreductase [Chloroherpetonaceae bacterium]
MKESEKNRLKSRYGTWALVTGASSGIGKEIAVQLASAGFNLILTARRKPLLDELAKTLSQTCRVKVQTISADMAEERDVQLLIEYAKAFEIGLAVLNAGFGTSGKFLNASLETELNMLDVNCASLLSLTHHFARRFSEQGRGGIILMSSLVGFQGVPNAAHYAATKGYVLSLGEALAVELKPNGVDVLVAAPGPVETGFAARANMKMNGALKAEDVSLSILEALGRTDVVLPGTLTKLLIYSLRTVPRWAKVRIMNLVMGGMTKHQTLSTHA